MYWQANGPISIAEFMRLALMHPTYGYYCVQRDAGIFGQKGDFITSPEISQLFGESLGVWFLDKLQKTRSSSLHTVRLVELGPGRGTLMADLLRDICTVRECHLVEASPWLKSFQQSTLIDKFPGVQFSWHSAIQTVPISRTTTLLVAHEFYDALPIHAFKKVGDEEWREVMVDTVDVIFDKEPNSVDDANVSKFRFVTAPSAGVKLLKIEKKYGAITDINQSVETCPEAAIVTKHVGELMEGSSDAHFLAIDYGDKTVPKGTLRAIKHHSILEDPLEQAGACDLTANVNFSELEQSLLSACNQVEIEPLQMQGQFLLNLGIRQRAMKLIEANPQQSQKIAKEFSQLTDPKKMGSVYKVLAASRKPEKS